MNTPVSLEIERLLIEKDIDMPVSPTIADVVMWLYENHGIWIYVSDNSARLGFRYQIQRLKILGENNFSSDEKFESPTEAYSQAIIYTLKNLI